MDDVCTPSYYISLIGALYPMGKVIFTWKKYIPPPLQHTLPRQCKQRRSLSSGVNASFCVQQNDEDLADKASITYLYTNSLSRNLHSVFREFSKWTRQHVCMGLLYSALFNTEQSWKRESQAWVGFTSKGIDVLQRVPAVSCEKYSCVFHTEYRECKISYLFLSTNSKKNWAASDC